MVHKLALKMSEPVKLNMDYYKIPIFIQLEVIIIFVSDIFMETNKYCIEIFFFFCYNSLKCPKMFLLY